MRIPEVVERAKEKTGSDYKTAEVVGVPRQTVGKWRKGETEPGFRHGLRLCRVAGIDPKEVETEAKQLNPTQASARVGLRGDIDYTKFDNFCRGILRLINGLDLVTPAYPAAA